MKNLNGMINELVRDLCQIGPMPKSLVRKNIRDIVETALKECRPGEEKPVDWTNIGDPGLIANQSEAYGYNQCLSEYDERVKNYIK